VTAPDRETMPGKVDAPRYAIYFVPPADTDIYRFGAGFLGYDCYSGAELGYSEKTGLRASEWGQLTREPRTYGFHATLKAPFRLLPAFAEKDLAAELTQFAALPRIVPMIEPVVRALAQFIAIVPAGSSADIDRLAADCVMAFERFRRPPTPEERSKRLGAALTRRQIENLDRWGYPYVFEEFRFHMTLTGRVDPQRRDGIVTLLQALLNHCNGSEPLPIVRVALVRQDAASAPFRVVAQAELRPR
jgi:putative phosphonate metabolism protein